MWKGWEPGSQQALGKLGPVFSLPWPTPIGPHLKPTDAPDENLNRG